MAMPEQIKRMLRHGWPLVLGAAASVAATIVRRQYVIIRWAYNLAWPALVAALIIAGLIDRIIDGPRPDVSHAYGVAFALWIAYAMIAWLVGLHTWCPSCDGRLVAAHGDQHNMLMYRVCLWIPPDCRHCGYALDKGCIEQPPAEH